MVRVFRIPSVRSIHEIDDDVHEFFRWVEDPSFDKWLYTYDPKTDKIGIKIYTLIKGFVVLKIPGLSKYDSLDCPWWFVLFLLSCGLIDDRVAGIKYKKMVDFSNKMFYNVT